MKTKTNVRAGTSVQWPYPTSAVGCNGGFPSAVGDSGGTLN